MKLNLNFNKAWFKQHRKSIAIISMIALIVIAMFLFVTSVPNVAFAQATVTPTNTLTPSPTPTLTPTPLATGLANPSGNVQYMICGRYSFGEVTPGACFQVYNGSDIEVKSSTGRTTFLVEGETGNVLIYGTIQQAGSAAIKCVNGSQSITGSGTAIPATLTAAGISTPQFVRASLNTDSTGDLHHLSTTNSAGVVTLKVWNSALTPAAASGAATIDYEICGN